MEGGYFWSSIFLNLNYINNDVMKLLNIGKKFVTNFLMSLKFLCQVGDFGFDFQNFLWGNVFLKKHAKSKVFQNFYGQPAFLIFFSSKFSDKMGSWGMIHTGGHRPWSQKLRL